MRGIHIFTALFFTLIWADSTAHAEDVQLGQEIPGCKMPAGKPLPAKYYAAARKWKQFSWVRNAQSNALVVDGSGYERVSRMFNWHTFEKLDINGDGICDWFLTSLAPYSTGGDSGVLNTLYMGTAAGWRRVGAKIPDSKPDVLGAGNSSNEQADYAFSSAVPLALWDQKNHLPYLIGGFDSRHFSDRRDQAGYHVYRWDSKKYTLQELDKWEPGSVAAQVYAYFKRYGAIDPGQTGKDRLVAFNPAVEQAELDRGCKDDAILERSRYFALACKARAN